jgi:hypothetical protein
MLLEEFHAHTVGGYISKDEKVSTILIVKDANYSLINLN